MGPACDGIDQWFTYIIRFILPKFYKALSFLAMVKEAERVLEPRLGKEV